MGTGAFIAVLAFTSISVESRTLLTAPVGSKDLAVIQNERIVGDGKVIVRSRRVGTDGDVSFGHKEYREDGTPIAMWQEGEWSDRWNRFETVFGKKEARQIINGEETKTPMEAKAFRDPTVTWFWRKMPKARESVTVKFLAQNTIATYDIRFTYEGDEELTLAGRKVRVHRVREEPLGAPKAVYTIWWYDDKGMGVRRYHKTTTNEYTFDLKAWQ